MEALVWIGAFLSLLGVGGLISCVIRALRLRRAGLPDPELRAGLQRVIVLNMGALGVSALGLILVVTGVFLG